MRHRTYKREHLPASLRPTVAAAMVRLADLRPGNRVLDPMCGAGTILAELHQMNPFPRGGGVQVCGGDRELNAVQAAALNLRRLGHTHLVAWDARRLPLANACVDRLLCNPPFGKQLGTPEQIAGLYRQLAAEWDRVLSPGARAVVLVMQLRALKDAVRPVDWNLERSLRVRILGQLAALTVWRKKP